MEFDEICARDLMTPKLVFIEPTETLRTAARVMVESGIHSLLVAPQNARRAAAILTGKDCIQVIGDAGEDALDALCVEDVMTRPAMTVPAGLCIADCIQMMRLSGVRVAPVLEDGEIVGILSFSDILSTSVRDKSERRARLAERTPR